MSTTSMIQINPFAQLITSTTVFVNHSNCTGSKQAALPSDHFIISVKLDSLQLTLPYIALTNSFVNLMIINHMIAYMIDLFQFFTSSSSQLAVTNL
jgi:hypothetical protein